MDFNYKDVLCDEEVKAFLRKSNENLEMLGYTDHAEGHCVIVAKRAGSILAQLGYSKHEVELAQIAGAIHDIGNFINRNHHAEYGAILAYHILTRLEMPLEDRVTIASAIGNHDESTGCAVDVISAALILADKTDVRRIDEEICTMYEYFEIFLGRMMMCRQAAELLGQRFKQQEHCP